MSVHRARPPLAGAEQLLEPGAVGRARLAWRLLRDPRVSALKFAVPLFALLYLVSPLDPIPDFLIGIGQVDDLGVVIALVLLTTRILPRLAPAAVVAEHAATLSGGPPVADDPRNANDAVIEGAYRVRR